MPTCKAEPITATLNIRGIDTATARRIKGAAAARGMTIGEYLAQAIQALDAMRALADSGRHDQVAAELRARGMETVMT